MALWSLEPFLVNSSGPLGAFWGFQVARLGLTIVGTFLVDSSGPMGPIRGIQVACSVYDCGKPFWWIQMARLGPFGDSGAIQVARPGPLVGGAF
jgi:hypothetical protein